MNEEVIYGDPGSGVTFDGETYRVIYDSGESAGSYTKKRVITKEQYLRYITSDSDAYRVLLEVDQIVNS